MTPTWPPTYTSVRARLLSLWLPKRRKPVNPCGIPGMPHIGWGLLRIRMRGPARRGACLWRELERVRRRSATPTGTITGQWTTVRLRAIAMGCYERAGFTCAAGKHSQRESRSARWRRGVPGRTEGGTKMSPKYVKVAMFIAIIVVLAVAVPALAKGPGGGGARRRRRCPGGGGAWRWRPHRDRDQQPVGPTIMIGGTMGLESEGLAMPTGDPLTGYPIVRSATTTSRACTSGRPNG